MRRWPLGAGNAINWILYHIELCIWVVVNIRASSLTLQALWQQRQPKLVVFPSGAALVWRWVWTEGIFQVSIEHTFLTIVLD